MEGRRTHSRSWSPVCGSLEQQNHIEAGGLSSPLATAVEEAAGATKSVIPAVIEGVAMDVPRAPSLYMVAAPDVATATVRNPRSKQQCISATSV
jgi:hypothetical protein